MEKKPLFRRLLPYIVALAAFIAIPAIYFAPQFSGKVLRQSDIIQYKGKTEEVIKHREKYNEDPQWLGNTFSGMPANLTNMQHETMLIVKVKPYLDFLGTPASMIFIAMAAFFVMLLLWGLNPWAAIVPSIAYGLSTYFFIIIDVGHVTKMWALAYTPLMMGGVFYAFRKNMWLGAALTAFFAALVISTNHTQIPYYFAMVLLAFWINEGITAFREKAMPKFLKVTGLMAAAFILAVGANSSSLYDVYQYSKDSIRGGSELTKKTETEHERGSGLDLDYATAWSYGKAESFNMFIPDLMGGSSGGGFDRDGEVAKELSKYGARDVAQYLGPYWGTQPGTAGPTYIGAVIIFLCVLGLFLLRGRCKWWVVAVTLVALMLAWGRNFMWFTEFFFNYFPGYNKFRVVAMILVIAEWSVPFIAALLLGKLWKDGVDKPQLLKALKYSVIVTGGIALFFLVLGGTVLDFTSPNDKTMLMQLGMSGGLDQQSAAQFAGSIQPAMVADRISIMHADALRSLVFVLLTAGTVWLFAIGKMKKWLLVLVLAVLVCADIIPVNLRYLPQERFVEPRNVEIRPTEADKQILADTTKGFRVLNLTVSPFNDGTTSYFHRSVGGYDGAKMQRYQDIIDMYLGRGNMEVVDMLNTRYIIERNQQTGQPVAGLNPGANGSAWFIDEVIVAGSPDEEIETVGRIDTKKQAVADKRFAPLFTMPNVEIAGQPAVEVAQTVYADGQRIRFVADSMAYIKLTDYKPNHLVYETNSSQPGIAVFSEIYYDKGWKAYVDGVEAPHFRVDYILRGMLLPAGKHKVEFRYRAENFDTVSTITLIASLIIIIGVIAAAVATVMCKRKKGTNDVREQKA